MNPLKFSWIDYSSDHRDKVMAVLHALSTKGAFDELGIGQIKVPQQSNNIFSC